MANEFGVFLKPYFRKNDPGARYMITFTKQDGNFVIDRDFSDMIFDLFGLHEVFFGNIGGNYMMMMEAKSKAEEIILERAKIYGITSLSEFVGNLYDGYKICYVEKAKD